MVLNGPTTQLRERSVRLGHAWRFRIHIWMGCLNSKVVTVTPFLHFLSEINLVIVKPLHDTFIVPLIWFGVIINESCSLNKDLLCARYVPGVRLVLWKPNRVALTSWNSYFLVFLACCASNVNSNINLCCRTWGKVTSLIQEQYLKG